MRCVFVWRGLQWKYSIKMFSSKNSGRTAKGNSESPIPPTVYLDPEKSHHGSDQSAAGRKAGEVFSPKTGCRSISCSWGGCPSNGLGMVPGG